LPVALEASSNLQGHAERVQNFAIIAGISMNKGMWEKAVCAWYNVSNNDPVS
jgi:hypothetical protein